MKKFLSLILVLTIMLSILPAVQVPVQAAAPTFTQNQYNIAAWADYYYNMTWECQKTVYGWREQYTFYEGETYRIPYAQPVNSGQYIGYGISYEDFLVAAADESNVFYSKQAEWSGWVSVYYGTDCAAFVASCWGTFRHDCSTFQYTSEEIATLTSSTVSKIQLGDALDSYSMGHVVLVSDLIYDDNGNLTHIEITEQTPPQLKRTLHTPESLVAKYGTYYIIYRYNGSVPAAPEVGYESQCTPYAAHCQLQTTKATTVMSLPCTTDVQDASQELGTANAGQRLTGTRLFQNTAGELWYRVQWESGEGFVRAEDTIYLNQLLDDLSLTGASFPQSHVKGNTYPVTGTITSRYNALTEASVQVLDGFGTNGTVITGGTDAVSGNSYNLRSSAIDYATSFNSVGVGKHTYLITAKYKNYYVSDGTVMTNTGTVTLAEEYFRTVSAAVSNCTHSYEETVMTHGDCTSGGLTVYDCATCGKVYTEATDALGHSYGEWITVEAQCAAEGSRVRTCATCGHEDREIIPATGHRYDALEIPSTCGSSSYTQYTCAVCGHSYKQFPEEVMSDWMEGKPDVADDLIQEKTQYRYREAETIYSDQEYLEGYDLLGYEWKTVSTGTNDYVSDWPSGFNTSHPYYTEYSDFVVEHQDGNQRLYLDGQPTTGFFYYHWCRSGYTSSSESKTGTYNTFHVFYSTVNPADHTTYDSSDDSYKFHNDCCSNSDWYYVAYVSTQQYSIREKQFLQGHWGEWSEWSEEPVQEDPQRQVESRTIYRYANAEAGNHSYGEWTLDVAPDCTNPGQRIRTCSQCGSVQTESVAATGHSYEATEVPASCIDYAHTQYTCGGCGEYYKEYPQSDWMETLPEGVDDALVKTKTQYRYRDTETFTSFSPEEADATQISSRWVPVGTDKIQYVKSWPAGFDTANALYDQYNNQKIVGEYEVDGERLTIDSDQVGGYLYYHWCSPNDPNHYSYANQSGTHNIFHAYYSTTNPNTYICDTSDMSYKTSHSCCSNGNSAWFFVAEVYEQTYTISHKEYTHQRWGQWSDWSDEVAEASDTRQIQTRTLYSVPVGEYADHSVQTVTVDPTCTEAGHVTHTCTTCGESREETLEATGHNYDHGVCQNCGEKDPDYIPDYYLFGYINNANYACEEDFENMGEYLFVDGQLTVTFQSDSYVAVKTTNNGTWYMTNGYPGDEATSALLFDTNLGIDANKLRVPGGVEVTFTLVENGDGSLLLSYVIHCTHESHDASGKCIGCGTVVGHHYETDTTNPTCTEDGLVVYTCQCGMTYTEIIPTEGHRYQSVTVEPTCTAEGSITYTCTACGDSYSESIPVIDHSYESVTVDPTCTAEGSITYTCTACGDSYSEILPVIDHSYESVTVDPTCTAEGSITYTCTACGDSYSEILPVIDHSYESVTVDPTCTAEGSVIYTCTACGDSYSESIPVIDHSYESVTVDPTCTAEGSITYTCTACGDSYSEILPVIDHSYESVTVDPTCTAEGHTTHTCTACGDSYSESIPATGHSYGNWEMETAPQCETPGLMIRLCATCNARQEATVAAIGHNYVDGSCQYCGNTAPRDVIVPTLTLDHPSLSFEGEIMYNLYFTADDLTSVEEMGLLGFNTKLEDGTVETANNVYPGYIEAGGMYMGQTTGVPARYLGDAVYFKAYAKLSDGSYVYSGMVGYNAVVYAKSILKNSTNDYMKRLVVAMINYGAEAQGYFCTKEGVEYTPMNNFLTADQQAMISAYDASMVADLISVDASKVGMFTYNTGDFAKRTNSVSFDGAFAINYYFTAKGTPDNGMKFYYWNTADYEAADVLTPEDATGSMDMVAGSGNQYWGQVSGIAAKEVDQTYFVAGVYELDGVTYTTGILAYSLGKYCAKLAAGTTDQQALSAATAVYGYYAKEYFSNI